MTELSKSGFRTSALKARSEIKHRDAKSKAIHQRLLDHSGFQEATHILVYVSMRSEVNTHPLIDQLLGIESKNIYVPYCFGDVLRIFHLREWQQLAKKTFGVLEPKDEFLLEDYSLDTSIVDLTIVPGVAFDKNLNRLGYGKGFYDQLLTHSVPNSRRIAVAFTEQIFDKVPTTSWDVPMHEIVTENGTLL